MSLPTPYYEDEAVRLFHGDCREILPMIEPASIDLVFTSPPYNLGNTTGGEFPNRKREAAEHTDRRRRFGHYASDAPMSGRGGLGKWPGALIADGYGDCSDNMPHVEYVAWQHETLRACWDTLSDTGAIYFNHKPRVLDGIVVLPTAYVPDDLPIRQIVIWARAGGINFSPSFYVPTHEWIVVIAKPDFRLKSKGASGVGDVWYVPQEANPMHPAPFPMSLPARAIETTAGGTVLDPHAGSGTTLVAAKLAGRRSIGIEISEQYCEIAARRLRQGTLFPATPKEDVEQREGVTSPLLFDRVTPLTEDHEI